jgi:hypothetical protein
MKIIPEYIFENTDVKCSATPWDRDIFQRDTYELEFPVQSDYSTERLSSALLKITDVKTPSLFYGRIDGNSMVHKRALINAGFFSCETQLEIRKGRLSHFVCPPELGTKRLSIADGKSEDYDEIISVAGNVFNYSRFHEDPYIDPVLCRHRMTRWAEALKKQNTPLIVSRNRAGNLDAFLYYKVISSDCIELVLGGSLPGKGVLTPFFWASFLEFFKGRGINSVSTKISAANIVIVNIYMFFDFKVSKVLLDFHKHVS